MADRIFDSSWVDRYVRNELSEDEAMAFEAALFDSEALRSDVEAALALQSILTLDDESSAEAQSITERTPRRVQPWQPLAMAASFLVGVLGLFMWVQSSSEIAELERQVSDLNRPYSEVTLRRLDVMRSAGSNAGHAVRKPTQGGLLVLDIELSASAQGRDQLAIQLKGAEGRPLANWRGNTLNRERISLALPARSVSPGNANLEFSVEDEVIETWPIKILDSSD